MFAVVGKDKEERYWFKSDQRLTEVTDCFDFQVVEDGWWQKRWKLYGFRMAAKAYYNQFVGNVPAKIEEKLLGTYKSERDASMALEQVMMVKEITEIDPLTKQ